MYGYAVNRKYDLPDEMPSIIPFRDHNLIDSIFLLRFLFFLKILCLLGSKVAFFVAEIAKADPS